MLMWQTKLAAHGRQLDVMFAAGASLLVFHWARSMRTPSWGRTADDAPSRLSASYVAPARLATSFATGRT